MDIIQMILLAVDSLLDALIATSACVTELFYLSGYKAKKDSIY